MCQQKQITMTTYSVYDQAIAKEVLNSINDIDRFGQRLVSDSDIAWAKNVIGFFKAIYDKARSFVGDWCCRVSLAWQYAKGLIKEMINTTSQTIEKKMKKFGGRVLPDGTVLLGSGDSRNIGMTMKTHIKKFYTSK